MNENTSIALNKWIRGAGPDSYHKLDMDRFYDYVYQSVINEDAITYEAIYECIKENLKWVEEYRSEKANEFLDLAHRLEQFMTFLREEKGMI